MTIRPIEAGNHADWDRLWKGYLDFYKAKIAPDVCRTTFARLLDPAEPMHGALVLFDERPVGLVHYIFHRSTWTAGNYCYLQDLFVEDAMRGHGLGRRLIEHVYGEAKDGGASRVYWLTHETNTDAMLLYDRVAERSGFVQYRKLF